MRNLKVRYDFNACFSSKLQDFENLCTLLTMNKGIGAFRTSSSSQSSQDESGICYFVKAEEEKNEIVSSAWNTPNIEEKHDNDNINNITT